MIFCSSAGPVTVLKNQEERIKNQKEKGLPGFPPVVTARLTLNTVCTSLFVSSLIFRGITDLGRTQVLSVSL